MKKHLLFLSATLLSAAIILGGCGTSGQEDKTQTVKQTLKVGVTAGPHAEILDEVKKIAAKDGLQVETIEFNDYIQPNVALYQGELDLNSMQHRPYLDNIVKDRNYDLVEVAKSVNFPMAAYSQKFKKDEKITDGATIGIPNDPTNGGRALLLLAAQKLITLKEGIGVRATLADVTENPHNFQFKELDAAIIPRSLSDLDVAVINTNYAIATGMNPVNDSIFIESAESPFVNILVTKSTLKDDPRIQTFIKAYQSEATAKFIAEHFKGSVTPGWVTN
ncbi:MAG TPA: MetQ/NlpA family ABC transporter substrate-binding protein [Candidatus Avacidaminococcus intestinavium]|uniref:Lipoprotein n=1 Tax=Candidatus Avacidaminococcus intestinavium TaxID=2840684 RepID=A0A9D1MNT1_9FIRM|nr:MetQ/NlpA family ABC transporter substrate-binding protein [Candidatus Avacidaminococcus intestinavium]